MSFVKFHDFYGEWSRIVTETCLPRLSSAVPVPVPELSGNIDFVLRNLEWYYDGLNYFANNDSNSIPYFLLPSWRNSLEMPILFLGDIDPYLLAKLIRCLINRANQDSGGIDKSVPQDPYVQLLKKIDEIDGEIALTVHVLLERLSEAQTRFADRFSYNWVNSYDSQWRNVMETTASLMAHDMEEFVRIFIDANRLRIKVIRDIVAATSIDLQFLAPLFLECLCRIFAGFKDQGEEFQNSLSASPLIMNQHQYACEPAPVPYQTFTVMNQHPTAVPARIHSRPVQPPYHNPPAMNQHHAPGNLAAANRGAAQINNNAPPIPEYTIYVGHLNYEVTAEVLGDTFRDHYRSVRAAKVAIYRETGRSRGYGFVSFSDKKERRRALTEMDGQYCSNRRMRVRYAETMSGSSDGFSFFTWN